MDSKAYEIYKNETGGVTLMGMPMKEFNELPERIMNAWKAIDKYYEYLSIIDNNIEKKIKNAIDEYFLNKEKIEHDEQLKKNEIKEKANHYFIHTCKYIDYLAQYYNNNPVNMALGKYYKHEEVIKLLCDRLYSEFQKDNKELGMIYWEYKEPPSNECSEVDTYELKVSYKSNEYDYINGFAHILSISDPSTKVKMLSDMRLFLEKYRIQKISEIK